MTWEGCDRIDNEETDPYHAVAEMTQKELGRARFLAMARRCGPPPHSMLAVGDLPPGFTLPASEVDAALGRGVMRALDDDEPSVGDVEGYSERGDGG